MLRAFLSLNVFFFAAVLLETSRAGSFVDEPYFSRTLFPRRAAKMFYILVGFFIGLGYTLLTMLRAYAFAKS